MNKLYILLSMNIFTIHRFAKLSLFEKQMLSFYKGVVFMACLFCSLNGFGQVVISAGNNTIDGKVCVGEGFTLNAQVQSGGPVVTWQWESEDPNGGSSVIGNTEDINIPITLSTPGTYTYTVTADPDPDPSTFPSPNAVSREVEIEVVPLPVIASIVGITDPVTDPVVVCDGGILDFGEAVLTDPTVTATWVWMDQFNNIISTVADPASTNAPPLINNATTTYTYTVVATTVATDGKGCASLPVEVIVEVNPLPEVTFPNVGPVCEDPSGTTSVRLTGSTTSASGDWTLTDPNGTDITSNTLAFSQAVTDPGTYMLTFMDDNGCTSEVESTEVIINPIPDVTAPVTLDICDGEDLELEGIFTPAGTSTMVDTWNWSSPTGTNLVTSPSSNPTTISSVVLGTHDVDYTVMVTDNNTCTATAVVQVAVDPLPPMPTVTSPLPVCQRDPKPLSATIPNGTTGTLSWTDPSGVALTGQNPVIPSAMPADAGTYTVVVTDDNGCTSLAANLVVDVIPEPVFTLESSGLCDGGDLDLIAVTDPLSPPANPTWAWSLNGNPLSDDNTTIFGATTPTLSLVNPVTPGTYSVTLTDGGPNSCTSEQTIPISSSSPPEIQTSTQTETEVCSGEPVTLSVVTNPGNTYIWIDPNGNPITDVNGNPINPINTTRTSRITVTDPIPSVVNGSNITPSTYSIEITNSAGCSITETFDIIVHEAPGISADANDPLCLVDELELTASFTPSPTSSSTNATATYSWSGPSFTSTLQNPTITGITASQAGTYTVIVTDDLGCTAQSTEEVEIAQPTVTATSNSAVCIGERIEFTGTFTSNGATTNPDMWAWTGPSSLNPVATPAINSAAATDAGTYTVVVTDDLGCTATTTTTVVVNELPEVEDITLTACDDGTNVIFNLEDAETTGGSNISNVPLFSGLVNNISYHTALPTDNGQNAINAPTSYSVPSSSFPATVPATVTVIARVEDINGCVTEKAVTLEKTDLPTPQDVILRQCDDGSGSTTFILADAGVDVTSGATGVTVTYHTDAAAATAAITTHTISQTTPIYALVTDDATKCTSIAMVTLEMAPLPDVSPVILRACDDGNQDVNFDLTIADIDGDGTAGIPTTPTGYSAEYFNGTTLIPNPAAAAAGDGDVIFAVLTNPEGCSKQTTITIEFADPVANPLTLKLCDDLDGDGMVTFNLTDALLTSANSNIDGNGGIGIDVRDGTNNAVTFYTAPNGTVIDNNSNPPVTAYPVPLAGGTVIAEVTSGTNCTNSAIITLEISVPTTNEVTLEMCNEGSNMATFDLSEAANIGASSNATGMAVDNGSSMSITYNEANDGDPSTNIANFTNYMSGATTVYAVVKGLDGCSAIEKINLQVLDNPNVADTDLTLCETVAEGGMATFDLTHAEDPIGTSNTGTPLGGAANSGVAVNSTTTHIVDYYTASPTTANGVIIPATGTQSETAYTASDGDVVVAVITDPITGCTSEAEVMLNVISKPVVSNATIEGCDDGDGDDEIDFDLTTADIDGDGSPGGFATGGFTVTYYTASLPGGTLITTGGTPNSSAYPGADGDVVVAIVSKDGCESEVTINLKINTPIANDVVLRLCDDPALAANTASFNLLDALDATKTDNSMSVNGGSGTNMVTFHAISNTSTSLSSPYIAVNGATIEARILNPTTNCISTAEVKFEVDPLPTVHEVILEVCEDNPNSTSSMGTFILTDAEVAGGTSSNTGPNAVDNGSITTVVSYYDNTIASGNAAPISSPYIAQDGTVVYARVQDTVTGCETEVKVTLETKDSPPYTNITLQACNDGSNSALFDLDDAETASSGSNNSTNTINNGINTVQYFAGGTLIFPVTNYQAGPTDMVTAVITGDNGCQSEATVSFELLAPQVSDITLTLCDDSDNIFDGLASFELNKAEVPADPSNTSNMAVSFGHTVTYHQITPAFGTPAITPSGNPEIIAVDNTPIYALVDSMGCFSEATITLRVSAPVANDFTLVECGTGSINFNLRDADEDVNGGTSLNVSYYELNGTPIIPPQQYSAINNHTVIARVTGLDGCTNESTITLTVSEPTIAATPATIAVCEGEDIVLSSTLSGSASNATPTYSWTHPINGVVSTAANPTFPAMANSGGIYTVLVTDGNGCTATDMVTVTVNELPEVSVSPSDDEVCIDAGGTIVFTGLPTPAANTSGTFTSATTTGFTPTATGTAILNIAMAGVGTHTVTYTYKDDDGCEMEAMSTIEIFDLPAVAPLATDVCIGSTVAIDGVPSGGSGIYTQHTWTVDVAGSTGATNTNLTTANAQVATFDATGLTAGTVTLKYVVEDNSGCTNEGTVQVEINANPVVAPLATDVCIGSTVDIDGLPSGGSGTYTTHDWTITNAGNTGANNTNLTVANAQVATFDATGLAAGTVTLTYTVTDNNDCMTSGLATVEIQSAPLVTLDVDFPSICFEDPTGFIFTATPAPNAATGTTGIFTGPVGLIDNGNGTADLATAAVGTHTVTYTYKDADGCEASEMVEVEVFDLPVVTPVATEVCIDNTVNVAGVPSGGSGTYTQHTWTVSNPGTTGATNTNIAVNNLPTATFDATGLTAGIVTLNYLVTDNNLCSIEGSVMVEVHDAPIGSPVGPITKCVGDNMFIDGVPSGGTAPYTHAWTITNPGTTGATDAANLSREDMRLARLNALGLSAGTITLEYTVTDANGCFSTTEVDVILDPLPEALSLIRTCSEDFTTYDVDGLLGANDSIVSVSSGTLMMAGAGANAFIVTGINAGAAFSITLIDTVTECTTTQNLPVFSCDCPDTQAPSPLDVAMVCEGDSVQLMVTVDSTETVDWYNAAGTLIASGTDSLLVTIAGSYFAQTRDTVSGCTSSDRTEMVFEPNPLPSITLVSDICDATFAYNIIVITEVGNGLVADTGTVALLGTTAIMDTFEITNIPRMDSVIVTVEDPATGCLSEMKFFSPDCVCPTLAAPMLSNDTTLCALETIPAFSATAGTNQTTCWLDAAGDTVAMNSLTYTPTIAGVYSVVAKDTFTDCISDTAFVELTIDTLPLLAVLDTICTEDLSEYTILFSLGGGTNDTIITSIGILDTVGIDSFEIQQIPDDSTVVITVENKLTGCINAVTITNNCSCINPLTAPVAAMDTVSICVGDTVDLIVSIDSTETVDWYDTSGGLLLAGDTIYNTSIAGTYLAVTRDTVTECTGADSTAVVLIVNTPPTATIHNDNGPFCEDDNILLSSDILANVSYDWSTNGSAVISDTAAVAPFFSMVADGEVVTLIVTDTLTGCMAMTTDTLRIDSLPTISGIVVKCGTQQDSFEIEIMTNALTVASSHGVGTSGNNLYRIVGIPRDSVVTLTLGMTHCSLDTIIQPPVFTEVTGVISSPICPGEVVNLEATNTTADSLLWTTNGVGVFDTLSGPIVNVTGAVAGDIFVITAIDSATGCAAVDRDTLEEHPAPAAPVVVNQIICKDEPAIFTAVVPMGQTINWFDTIVGGTPLLVGPTFTSPETTSGTYTYYAQAVDAAGNGCVSGRTAFTLTILPLPNPNLTPTVSVCPGETTTLTPGLFNSYFWSTGATTASVDVGPGMYFVTVSDGNGCQAVSAVNVDTVSAQNLTVTIPSNFCTSDAPFALTGGSPAGGSYIGTGVSGSVFDPAVAGVGTYTITYALTGAGTCTESVNTQVTVMAPTTTSLALANTYCASDAAFTLTGGSPTGGTYTGTGVTNGVFDPAAVGAGTYVITYTIGTGTSCITSAVDSIVVEAVPAVSFTPVNTTTLCVQAGGVNLGGGSPAGGTYMGPGVTNGVFNPATAGIGTHTITYTVGSGNCTASATTTYTVTAAPTVDLQLGTTQVCNNAGSVTLTGGSPVGGTYMGTGVTNGVFDPAGLGAGNYTITYNYSAAGSCTGSATATITVAPTGSVSFAAGVNQLCVTQGLFTLSSGSPAGGTFSGTGVVGNTFNPATARAGTHTITYTGPASTCFATATSDIVVIGDTPVSFSMTPPNLCSNSGPVPLTGGSPAGGTYSGTGVSNGSFDPAVAGAGTHTISYATACGSATMTLEVRPQLTASLNLTRTSVCSTESSFTLSGGSPASTGGVNGTYSGQGVVNNVFNPSSVGPGTYPITYTLNPGFGCTGTATQMITVTTPGTSSLSLPTTNFCTTSGAITLSGGSPAGGTYSGNGVSNGVFNPATAGVGTHTISYSSNGCSSGATATVVVASSQGASFNLSGASICDNSGSFALSGGFPAGGTYSGTGVVNGNVFDPSTVSPGTYTLTYTVSDACAGTTSATANITIGGSNTGTLTLNNAQLCASSSAFVLTGGFPTGGTYSGPGVVGGNTFDPTIAGAGSHTINYNPNDGCSGISTDVIVVEANPPTPVLRMATEICVGEDLLLEATAVQGATSFSWTGPNGFTSFLQNPVIPNVSSLNRGTYNLVVNVGSCTSAMSSLNINVSNLPDPVTVTSTGTICQGSNFDLIVSNPTVGDTYTWFYQTGAFVGTGATLNLSSTNNAAGRYYVTINRGGCVYDPSLISNAPSFAFTDVTISAQAAVGAFAGQDATVCSDTYDLNALVPSNANVFGLWSTPVGSQVSIMDRELENTPVFNLQPGNNIFIWTLSNDGCLGLSSDTVVVNYATAPVLTDDAYSTFFNTPLNVDVLSNDQFTTGFFLDSIYTIGGGTAVINGDQTVSFAPNNSFVGTEQLVYRVCNNFCPTKCATATADITVGIDTTATIFLPNTITPNGDGDNDALIIPEVMQYPGSEIIIFNRWGDEVYRSNNYQNDWFGFWQDNNGLLPVGTYFYVLNLNNTAKTRMSGYVYIQRD